MIDSSSTISFGRKLLQIQTRPSEISARGVQEKKKSKKFFSPHMQSKIVQSKTTTLNQSRPQRQPTIASNLGGMNEKVFTCREIYVMKHNY